MIKKGALTVCILLILLGFANNASADLNSFLDKVNVEAKADMDGFSVKLSNQFGVPLDRVNTVLQSVSVPADAFMCFQLALMTKKKPDAVMVVYSKNKGKGWGVIAKKLGIKPGSPEFHALKRGDFVFDGKPGKSGKGKGKKKEK